MGHPVDLADGNLYHDFEDHALPGRMPLTFGRRYSSSLERSDGMFGPGWSSPFEAYLYRSVDGYTMVAENGETEVRFRDYHDRAAQQGETLRDPGNFCELFREGGRCIVRRWDPDEDEVVELVFEIGDELENWPLVAKQDLEGQGIDIERDEAGRITLLCQRREGRGYRLTYDRAGRLSEVLARSPVSVDERGRFDRFFERPVLSYGYDASGRLCEMTDALGQRCRYEYDAAGRMAREVNIGGMEYTFRYDAKGRCVDSSGANEHGRVQLQYDDHGMRTLVTDALGHATVYVWNEYGQIEQEISPLGQGKATGFDEEGRVVLEKTAQGHETRQVYDERGDRVEVVDANGGVTRYAHNELHQLVAVTDPAGHVWRRRHDGRGRVEAVENPLGEALSYVYDGRGDLAAVLDPLGARRELTWDEFGNLASATDWSGHVTTYEYDVEGNLTAVLDPLGQRTEATLDLLGRVQEVRLPDGATRRFGWDAYDQPTRYVDELGEATGWRYEHCGLLAEVTRPGGGKLRFDWSAIPGQLLGVVNERGERYELSYDPGGNLIEERDFSGRRTRYEHDVDGQVSVVHGPGERRTSIARDKVGAVTRVSHDDGSQVLYSYDARGLLLTADNGQCPLERAYDAVGRLVRESQGEHSVESEYDAAGNRVRRRSSLGDETRFVWDDNGQLATLRRGEEAPLAFHYDARQDELSRQVEGGVAIRQAHDARGRRVEQWVGLPSAGAGAGPVVHRRYAYDPASNLTEVWDQRWGSTRYAYDALGRMLSAHLPGHVVESLSYDATDNLTRIERQRAEGESSEARCSYGAGNVLASRGQVVYEHDAQGQRVCKREGRQETRYEWNRFGQLVGVELPRRVRWSYSYDALGRRVRKEGPAEVVEYVWDGDVVLHEIRRPKATGPVSWAMMQQGYGPSGLGPREVTHWEFDPEGFAPICKRSGEVQYLCVNDVAGNPRELVTQKGEVVWRAVYSALGEILHEESEGGVSCPVRLQGQWHDEETGLFYNRFRYYDPACGRFISPDPIGLLGGLNVYSFAGSTTGWIDPYGLANEAAYSMRVQIQRGTENLSSEPISSHVPITAVEVERAMMKAVAKLPPGEGGLIPRAHGAAAQLSIRIREAVKGGGVTQGGNIARAWLRETDVRFDIENSRGHNLQTCKGEEK